MIKGRVSIITPTYNRPKWLPDAIESVLAQTYHDIELIVVNDGSTDNTEEILKPYMDKIVYIYKENGGQGAAVNTGIAAATGEYIGRVDDDDLFVPEKTALQVEMFEKNPELGLVAGHGHIINSEGEIMATRKVPDYSKHGALLFLLQHCIFSQPTVMVRKECYDKVGPYRNIYGEDYEMWIRIARHYSVGVVDRPLAYYRRHDANLSRKERLAENNAEIRAFMRDIMDSISLEELVPDAGSIPHIYDIRGAIYMKHSLFKHARDEFLKAVKAEPENAIHRFWSGKLLQQMTRYEDAAEYFSHIPQGHMLYDEAQNALQFTERFQTVDPEDEDALTQLRRDLSEQHSRLLDMTIEAARRRG